MYNKVILFSDYKTCNKTVIKISYGVRGVVSGNILFAIYFMVFVYTIIIILVPLRPRGRTDYLCRLILKQVFIS